MSTNTSKELSPKRELEITPPNYHYRWAQHPDTGSDPSNVIFSLSSGAENMEKRSNSTPSPVITQDEHDLMMAVVVVR